MLNNGNCWVQLNNVIAPNNDLLSLDLECSNGSKLILRRCNSSRCNLKANFLGRYRVVSSMTKRMYDCIVPPGTKSFNCHSSDNLVYLTTCDSFDLQYDGEKVQKHNERFSGHKNGFCHPKNMFIDVF